jgi:coenzyme F420-reducing hydrogenase gamma subunit
MKQKQVNSSIGAGLRLIPPKWSSLRRCLRYCQGVFNLTMPKPLEEIIDGDVIVPGIPPGTTRIIEESQGEDTVFTKP